MTLQQFLSTAEQSGAHCQKQLGLKQSARRRDAVPGVLCQTITEACMSVSRGPAGRTNHWDSQVLTCPAALPNYHPHMLISDAL